MSAIVAGFRSPRLARAVLLYLAAFVGTAAWLPWARGRGPAPGWAVAAGLERPFSSAWLLAGVAVLFASTLACTWGRRARIAALRRGDLPERAIALRGDLAGLERFLRERGFRGQGGVLRRNGPALWAGWIFHVGLLVLVAGVALQQSMHDGGSFRLAEGETARLSAPGVVFDRERGLLAPAAPPDLEVTLVAFDPMLRQAGYAPDRASRLAVRGPGAAAREAEIDRAAGVAAGGAEIFQAIPTGPALVIEVAGVPRAVHLRTVGARAARADVDDPAGAPAAFVLETERDLADPRGPGTARVRVEAAAGVSTLEPGEPFPFGGAPARLLRVAWWGGFTWARNPGMPAVLAGFLLVLAGSALLAFPAGVARLGAPGEDPAGRVLLLRGGDVLSSEWAARQGSREG